MSSNQYNTTLTPIPDPNRSNCYLIQRPTFVSFADMQFTFDLNPSQSVRLREVITFGVQRVFPQVSHQWDNRPFTEAFLGHYVVIKKLEPAQQWATVSQKIIGIREALTDDIFSFSLAHEWEFRAYYSKGDRPGVQSIITACNSELRPSFVENTEITPQNALAFAKILTLLAKRELLDATSAILALTKPEIAGYRYPNGVNFRGLTQVDTKGFAGGQIATAIGDLHISLEPDWAILENVNYDIRAIDFAVLDSEPEESKFPEFIVCQLESEEPSGGIDNGCYDSFQVFLLTTPNAYPSLATAQIARFNSGLNPVTEIVERDWICPADSIDRYSYWSIEQPTPDTVSGCAADFNAVFIRSDTGVNRDTYRTLAEAQAALAIIGLDQGFQVTEQFFVCSSDPTFARTYWEILPG